MKLFEANGDDISDFIPGEVLPERNQIRIQVRDGSAWAWKRALKQKYPNAIVGKP